jgi:hypothetical protein
MENLLLGEYQNPVKGSSSHEYSKFYVFLYGSYNYNGVSI